VTPLESVASLVGLDCVTHSAGRFRRLPSSKIDVFLIPGTGSRRSRLAEARIGLEETRQEESVSSHAQVRCSIAAG
jgi:hypothetical protein